MKATVGIAELRQNLSRYLRRVERGERLIVTDRNRPVAEIGPPPTAGSNLDRLVAEGRVSRLDAVALLPLDRGLLGAAGALTEPGLRALDAIHVTAAVDLSPLDAFLSYDERQSAAARLAGLLTVSPGA